MRIITTVAEAQSLERSKRRVLVPTMGALHKAHAELIRVARERAGEHGEVAVSIFVNPLQFEPGSDYERARTFSRGLHRGREVVQYSFA